MSIEFNRDWTEFLSLLISKRVGFVLVGGHAVAAHGEPRLAGHDRETVRRLRRFALGFRKVSMTNEGNQAPPPASDTKTCPACAETIKAAAVKCRYCGEDLIAFAKARAEAEAEIEKDLFVGRGPVIVSVGQLAWVVLTLGIAYLVFWLRNIATTYHITTQRIRIERGILSKKKQTVELFRLDHFDVHKPLGMRMLGHAILDMSSSDPGFPSVVLRGIPNLETLAETLRECSLRERKRRAVTTFVNA